VPLTTQDAAPARRAPVTRARPASRPAWSSALRRAAPVFQASASHRQEGQAAVETVALLPIIALVTALLLQAALAGQAAWLAGSAARAAARAAAIEADPAAAARGVLPERLERGLDVRAGEDGVRVRIRVPAVAGRTTVLRVSATAHLQEQR
jgi:hypothetical protein